MKTRKVITYQFLNEPPDTDKMINYLEIHASTIKAKAWMNDHDVIIAMSNLRWLIPAVNHLPLQGGTFKLVQLETEPSHKKGIIYFNKHFERIDKVTVWTNLEAVLFVHFPEYNVWMVPVIDHTGHI
jgi:hypothetical protein